MASGAAGNDRHDHVQGTLVACVSALSWLPGCPRPCAGKHASAGKLSKASSSLWNGSWCRASRCPQRPRRVSVNSGSQNGFGTPLERTHVPVWLEQGVTAIEEWFRPAGARRVALSSQQPARVRVPRWIVLPWLLNRELWQPRIRTNRLHPKDLAISGGHPCLFGADTLVPRGTTIREWDWVRFELARLRRVRRQAACSGPAKCR